MVAGNSSDVRHNYLWPFRTTFCTETKYGHIRFLRAFDTVQRRRLLGNLSHYGINGLILCRIKAFLEDREQGVVVEGWRSPSARVLSGVPQGTMLGPVLFLIHINDVPSVVHSQVHLFADDCFMNRPIYSTCCSPEWLVITGEMGGYMGYEVQRQRMPDNNISMRHVSIRAFLHPVWSYFRKCLWCQISRHTCFKWSILVAPYSPSFSWTKFSLGFL